jgi:5-formyltetrahydrofolate cyclo-ligase
MTGSGSASAVALSYSLQIIDEGSISVTPNDVPVDALVSPAGVIPISPAALDRYNQVNSSSI